MSCVKNNAIAFADIMEIDNTDGERTARLNASRDKLLKVFMVGITFILVQIIIIVLPGEINSERLISQMSAIPKIMSVSQNVSDIHSYDG